MPASKRNVDTYKEVAKKKRSSRRIRRSGQRVVNLFNGQTRKEQASLTNAEREQLVIEFRLKARKLARSILRRWNARLDLQEVDSIVDLSLCEAVKRFDPTKGATFMTFLFYHLRGNLIRAVSAAASANLVPVGDYDSETSSAIKSTDSYRGINAIEVAEALCSHEHMMPDEVLFKKELVRLSERACNKLDTLEREVIHRVYIKEQQLMDIAHSLGYSRCHISRVKKKALETLYEEMTVSMQGSGEEISKEVQEAVKRVADRRRIHRRRPRSKKAQEARRAVVEQQELASAA